MRKLCNVEPPVVCVEQIHLTPGFPLPLGHNLCYRCCTAIFLGVMESFFGTLKNERVHNLVYRTHLESGADRQSILSRRG